MANPEATRLLTPDVEVDSWGRAGEPCVRKLLKVRQISKDIGMSLDDLLSYR